MSELSSAMLEVRAELNTAASEFLPDLCDLFELGLVDDGLNGKTEGQTSRATNLPCRVEKATGSGNQIVVNGVTYAATHRITFGANDYTMAIEPDYLLRVQANDNHEEMIFEQPNREKGSMPVFVSVLAKLTTGFRSPPNP